MKNETRLMEERAKRGEDLACRLLVCASAYRTGDTDFAAWHRASATEIGEILTMARTVWPFPQARG